MAQILNSFGFHTRNVTDTDTNTNLGNADLTADATRSYDVDGNTLDFNNGGNSIINIAEDSVTFGDGNEVTQVAFKFGANAPEIQIYEASTSGTNYVKLTCGALASNRTQTFPDATGTFALLESDQTFTGKINIEKRELKETSSTAGDGDGDVVYIGTSSVQGGKVYYFDGTDWAASDADAVGTASGLLGIALGTGDSNSVGVLVRGIGTLGTTTGGSNGDVLYLSTTPSALTSTAPTGSGDIVRVVGYLLDSTDDVVFFNPDGTYITIA